MKSAGILVLLFTACTVLPPRRQYIASLRQSITPKELARVDWVLGAVDAKVPDCAVSIRFLEQGQFTIRFKDRLYEGDNLWYVVKDSTIEFHVRPLEKIAWTQDSCEMNPSSFAFVLMGDHELLLEKDRLTLISRSRQRLIFISR